MCNAQGPQRSDASEARTSGPSVSSQALYHWATALPFKSYIVFKYMLHFLFVLYDLVINVHYLTQTAIYNRYAKIATKQSPNPNLTEPPVILCSSTFSLLEQIVNH